METDMQRYRLLQRKLQGELRERDDGEWVRWEDAERLQAIVDKLPKTADGVSVVPGMTLYRPRVKVCGCREIIEYRDGDTVEGCGAARRFGHTNSWLVQTDECYSTCEAAERGHLILERWSR